MYGNIQNCTTNHWALATLPGVEYQLEGGGLVVSAEEEVSTHPYDMWGKSAVAGTKTSNSWCEKCDYRVTSYNLWPSLLGR